MHRHYGGCTDSWSAQRQARDDARRDAERDRYVRSHDLEPYDCPDANHAYRQAYEAEARRERWREEERRQEEAALEAEQRRQMEEWREREELAAAEEAYYAEFGEALEAPPATDDDLPF